MTRSRTLRFTVLLTLAATAMTIVAAAAWGKPLLHERFHDEGTMVFEDFCDVPGLDVELAFAAGVSVLANPHGRERVPYFLEQVTESGVYTNLANRKSVSYAQKVIDHDLHITVNGDGTLTILATSTGNAVLYGPNGEALARNPGQTRVELHIDYNGTLNDPFDDEFLGFEIVKESTGRSDDFCAAAVAALS